MFKVSHSKIKTWRRCRRAYHYKYVENLQPRRKARPLVFGSIVHEMIEAHANGDDPQVIIQKYNKDSKKLFSAERGDYLQIITDAALLMKYYFKYYSKDPIRFISVKRKLAEHEFEVDLAKGIKLKGKIDALGRDTEDRVWLIEHKSHKEVPNDDVRFRDLQTVIYTSVLPSLGIKHSDGVMWDYVRSKPPAIPSTNKDGQLSRAKIDTFKEVYLEAIKENGLDPKDYKSELRALEGNERNYFKRVFMPNSPQLSKELLSDTVETAKEMLERGGKDKTRNITRDCSWCSYEKLCKAELLDLDADYIRKKEFIKEEKDDERPD